MCGGSKPVPGSAEEREYRIPGSVGGGRQTRPGRSTCQARRPWQGFISRVDNKGRLPRFCDGTRGQDRPRTGHKTTRAGVRPHGCVEDPEGKLVFATGLMGISLSKAGVPHHIKRTPPPPGRCLWQCVWPTAGGRDFRWGSSPKGSPDICCGFCMGALFDARWESRRVEGVVQIKSTGAGGACSVSRTSSYLPVLATTSAAFGPKQ
eukprot:gene1651-biopygen13907